MVCLVAADIKAIAEMQLLLIPWFGIFVAKLAVSVLVMNLHVALSYLTSNKLDINQHAGILFGTLEIKP